MSETLIPPHDLDSEAAVLSAVMIDGTTGRQGSALDEIADIVSPDDFYSSAHRHTFAAMLDLRATGAAVDVVQVGTRLKDRGLIAEVGGMAYLTEILNAAPAVRNVQAYARTVREKSVRRALIRACQVTASKGYVDPAGLDTLMAEHERAVLELASTRSTAKGLRPISKVVGATVTSIVEMAKRGGGMQGIPTGWPNIDRRMGGLCGGDVTIVAARPGMGKTAWVLQLARQVAEQGHPVAVFELEMPDRQLGERMLASGARVELPSIRQARINQQQWTTMMAVAGEIAKLPIYVDDTPSMRLADVAGSLRRLRAELAREKKQLRVAILDYLQLLKLGRAERQDIAIGEVTRGLKVLAKELEIALVVLAQLNRGCESRPDKRPLISDLRGSGDIEQDADNVCFLYRDGYYDADCERPNVAEFIVAKQRNGPQGIEYLHWDGPTTTFHELAIDESEGGYQ